MDCIILKYLIVCAGMINSCEALENNVSQFLDDLVDFLGVKHLMILNPNSCRAEWMQDNFKLFKVMSRQLYSSIAICNPSQLDQFIQHSSQVLLLYNIHRNEGFNSTIVNQLCSRPNLIWLILTETESNYDLLNGIHIPINCLFLLATSSDDGFNLEAVYHIWEGSPISTFKNITWRKDKGVRGLDLPFEKQRENMQGALMVVRTIPDRSGGLWTRQRDFFPDNWRSIEKHLNATSQYVDSGEVFDLDIGANGFHPPSIREQCLFPVIPIRINLFYREPMELLVWDKYLQPFTATAWWVVVAWLFVFSTSAVIARNIIMPSAKQTIIDVVRFVYDSFFILVQQGSEMVSVSVSCQLISCTQLFGSFLIFGAYSAVFISFVTVFTTTVPFYNLEGVNENGRYNIVVVKAYSFIKSNSHPTYQQLLQRVMPQENKPNSFIEAFQKICSTEDKLLTELTQRSIGEFQTQLGSCHIAANSVPLLHLQISWMTRRHLPYSKIIEKQYLKLREGGAISELVWQRDFLDKSFERQQVRPPDSIRLLQVLPLISIYALIAVVAFIILTIERALFTNNLIRV